MVNRKLLNVHTGGIATMVAGALVIAGCGSSGSSATSSASAAGAKTTTSTSAPTQTASASGVSVGSTKGPDGTYLTGPNGHALYLWVPDKGGKSVCSGACAKAWPPLITKGKPTAGTGVNASDLGMSMRSDGTEQVTYSGHPLYYFVADTAAGQTKGEGSKSFGAPWWLVAPSGTEIAMQASSGSSSGSSTGSSGY